MEFDFSPFLRFVSKTTYFIDETVVARDCRILYIVSGSGSFESNGKTVELSANTLVYYPYGNAYRIRADAGMLFYTINFDFSKDYIDIETQVPEPVRKHSKESVLSSISGELAPCFSKVLCFDNAIWAEEDIRHIYQESFEQSRGHVQMQEMYLKILLINIYRNYIREESHNLLCRKIKGIIHSNLKLNIKEIAETLNYHPFYLNEVFKKNEGSTLHKYLMKHRLAKAMELINTTQLSLEEIAALCGFSSQAHFSAAFKSAYHISPGRMRRQT